MDITSIKNYLKLYSYTNDMDTDDNNNMKSLVIIPRTDDDDLLNISKKQYERLKSYLKSNHFKKSKEEFMRYYYYDMIIEERDKYSVKNIRLDTDYLSFIEIKTEIDDFDFPHIVSYDHEEKLSITKYKLDHYYFEIIETANIDDDTSNKYFRIVLELNDDLSLKTDKIDSIKKIFKL